MEIETQAKQLRRAHSSKSILRACVGEYLQSSLFTEMVTVNLVTKAALAANVLTKKKCLLCIHPI